MQRGIPLLRSEKLFNLCAAQPLQTRFWSSTPRYDTSFTTLVKVDRLSVHTCAESTVAGMIVFQATIHWTRCVRNALTARILMWSHRSSAVRNGQRKYWNYKTLNWKTPQHPVHRRSLSIFLGKKVTVLKKLGPKVFWGFGFFIFTVRPLSLSHFTLFFFQFVD